jgi:hypothetical protein
MRLLLPLLLLLTLFGPTAGYTTLPQVGRPVADLIAQQRKQQVQCIGMARDGDPGLLGCIAAATATLDRFRNQELVRLPTPFAKAALRGYVRLTRCALVGLPRGAHESPGAWRMRQGRIWEDVASHQESLVERLTF